MSQDTVIFGNYAGEAIEWIILEIKPDGSYVLLSKNGVDAKAYNEKSQNITWETCTLRAWLNREFYRVAFTKSERNAIDLTDIANPDNERYGTEGGNDTKDYVFLLSLDEIQKYYGNRLDGSVYGRGTSDAIICHPTKYAINNRTWQLKQEIVDAIQPCFNYPLQEGAGCWWLRSPGSYQNYAASVNNDGYVSSDGRSVDYTRFMIRPVIVVSYQAFSRIQ